MVEKCKLCLDRAGAIGLELSPLVFGFWASWGPLAARLFPRTIPEDTSTIFFTIFVDFVRFLGAQMRLNVSLETSLAVGI